MIKLNSCSSGSFDDLLQASSYSLAKKRKIPKKNSNVREY